MTPDPTDIRDFYEERAAMIEFEGERVSRFRAESIAVHQTAREFGLTATEVRWLLIMAAQISA